MVSDSHLLRTEICLLNAVLLLLDGERDHENFNNDGEDADTEKVVAKANCVCDPTESSTDPKTECLKNISLIVKGNHELHCVNNCFNVACAESCVSESVVCVVVLKNCLCSLYVNNVVALLVLDTGVGRKGLVRTENVVAAVSRNKIVPSGAVVSNQRTDSAELLGCKGASFGSCNCYVNCLLSVSARGKHRAKSNEYNEKEKNFRCKNLFHFRF